MITREGRELARFGLDLNQGSFIAEHKSSSQFARGGQRL
jgi:hypothetical protein